MNRVSLSLEYIFKSSPNIIFQFLTASDCLVRWYCDEANLIDGVFTYGWDGNEEFATILDQEEGSFLRLTNDDLEENEYLEFVFSISPVTGETIMVITTFCDADEVEDVQLEWDTQVKNLQKALGEY